MKSKLLLATAALASAGVPASAHAAILQFDFVGDDGRSFAFQLDDTLAPSSGSSFGSATRITYNNIAGSFIDPDGTSDVANISFGTGFFSTLQIGAVNFSPNTFRGPALFDGSRNNPKFNLGNFALTGSVLNTTNGTLSVSAIPEPATWAMMLLGFFAVGAMIRSKGRVRTKVSYS